MRHQEGYIWKKGSHWYGRWYDDVLVDGQIVRKAKVKQLAPYCDRYRNPSDVQSLLDDILRPINEGKSDPRGTMTVVKFYENHFRPHVKADCKPATAVTYDSTWTLYLSAHLGSAIMRDFRCVDATNLFSEIHAHHGVGRTTLRKCKAVLSAVFTYAKQTGVLDGMNPVIDAGIPKKAHKSKPTQAATAEHVTGMLHTLTGIARLAVALVFFCGLRPGEARGARWEDYDGKVLLIRRSVWRTYITDTKTEGSGTEDSGAPVPVCEPLRRILDEQREATGFILAGPSGKPINLANLARRVVVPTLRKKNVPWYGWYALRRGIGTLATALDSDLAAKGWLRHANIATTRQFYIKDVPPETQRAADKVGELFSADGPVQ